MIFLSLLGGLMVAALVGLGVWAAARHVQFTTTTTTKRKSK